MLFWEARGKTEHGAKLRVALSRRAELRGQM
jgi:hypothetical protein